MDHSLLEILLIVLATGTVAVALCLRLGLSPILGYLATGLLVGPHAFGWLPDSEETRFLAELGIVLLMFTIGLEFSLPRLMASRRLVLGLGGAQVVVTSLLVGLLAWWLGMPASTAFVVGGALAMSSTAIVLKQLGEQMELPAPHGRVVTGILLFQDIAAVPFLVVLPVLAGEATQMAGALALALFKAVLVFALLVFAGRRLLEPVLHWVANTRSLELFMLTALLLALSAAGISALAGLSATLGAFMAGMLIGETLFRHQIESDIRPFRDLMLGLFFVTIGMRLDPRVMLTALPGVVFWLLLATVAKTAILLPLIRLFGHDRVTALRASVSLAQGGEFGLLLLSMGIGLGIVTESAGQPLLAAIILSMVLAPLLVRYNSRLADWLFHQRRTDGYLHTAEDIARESEELSGHVIICGYGRVGQNLAKILDLENIPNVALDLDPERVRQARNAGGNVLFGDVSRRGILQAAGLDRARVVAITFDQAQTAEQVIMQIRHHAPELPVLVRSLHDRDEERLQQAGADVFPEGLESSLAFAAQLLVAFGVAPSSVEARINAIRAEDYAVLRAFFHDSNESREDARDYAEQIRTVIIGDRDYAVGRTVEELGLKASGVTLLDVRRGALRVPGRMLDTHLRAGDVLVLKGKPNALERAISRLTEGA